MTSRSATWDDPTPDDRSSAWNGVAPSGGRYCNGWNTRVVVPTGTVESPTVGEAIYPFDGLGNAGERRHRWCAQEDTD
jgi:hypothetical protein